MSATFRNSVAFLLATYQFSTPSLDIWPGYALVAVVNKDPPGVFDAGAVNADENLHRRKTVQIRSDLDVVLSGELRIPAGSRERRYPVVLLLGGGGPSPHGIYPNLEERLLQNGIATLSYDKRGIGKSTGRFVDTIDLMRHDAGVAIQYLRSRHDIDDRRIAVLGLSQGGVIGPMLASNDPSIKAVVMLAAPAGQRGVMFLDEMQIKLTASGMQKGAVENVMAATRVYMELLTSDAVSTTTATARRMLGKAFVAAGWSEAQSEGALNTLSDPVTVSLYVVAASDVLKRVKVPVLALYASDDTVISTPRSLPEARFALQSNRNATVIEIPDVNHGFQHRESGASGTPEYKGWPVSDPKTLDLIDQWLTKRLVHAGRE